MWTQNAAFKTNFSCAKISQGRASAATLYHSRRSLPLTQAIPLQATLRQDLLPTQSTAGPKGNCAKKNSSYSSQINAEAPTAAAAAIRPTQEITYNGHASTRSRRRPPIGKYKMHGAYISLHQNNRKAPDVAPRPNPQQALDSIKNDNATFFDHHAFTIGSSGSTIMLSSTFLAYGAKEDRKASHEPPEQPLLPHRGEEAYQLGALHRHGRHLKHYRKNKSV